MQPQETSQTNGGLSSTKPTLPLDQTLGVNSVSATDIIALRDRRMKDLLTERGKHLASVGELDAELKQLGNCIPTSYGDDFRTRDQIYKAIGRKESYTGAAGIATGITEPKRRGRPAGSKNRAKPPGAKSTKK